MSWPTSGMVAPDFSHSTLRSSRGDGGSGSSSFFTHAGGPWAFRRLSQGRLLGVCCFSGCWPAGSRRGGAEGETDEEGERDADPSQNREERTREVWAGWQEAQHSGEGRSRALLRRHKGCGPHTGSGSGAARREGHLEAACSAALAWLSRPLTDHPPQVPRPPPRPPPPTHALPTLPVPPGASMGWARPIRGRMGEGTNE